MTASTFTPHMKRETRLLTVTSGLGVLASSISMHVSGNLAPLVPSLAITGIFLYQGASLMHHLDSAVRWQSRILVFPDKAQHYLNELNTEILDLSKRYNGLTQASAACTVVSACMMVASKKDNLVNEMKHNFFMDAALFLTAAAAVCAVRAVATRPGIHRAIRQHQQTFSHPPAL